MQMEMPRQIRMIQDLRRRIRSKHFRICTLSAVPPEMVKTGCSFKAFLQVLPPARSKNFRQGVTSKHYSIIANDTQVEEPCILFILEWLLTAKRRLGALLWQDLCGLGKAVSQMSRRLSQFPLDSESIYKK